MTNIFILLVLYIALYTHLKRLLSSRSAGGSVVMRLTSSCMQWSWERKRSSRRFWALHSCRTSSSSINSLSVTSSLSSRWSMWEVVCRSNFQNMVAAGTGDTALRPDAAQRGPRWMGKQNTEVEEGGGAQRCPETIGERVRKEWTRRWGRKQRREIDVNKQVCKLQD